MTFVPALIAAATTLGSTMLAKSSTGQRPSNKQLSTQTKEQREMAKLIQMAIKDGKGPLADLLKGFDMDAFNEGVSKPALQNFTDNILPQLQEKFIGSGQAGSPGAAREIGKAGQNLQSTLANLLFNAQQADKTGKNNNLLSLLQLHQNPASENVHTPGHSGIAPSVFKAGAGITGDLAAKAWDKYTNPPPATTTPPATQTPATPG